MTQEEKDYLHEAFAFERLRHELNLFFQDNALPTFSNEQWNTFLSIFLDTVEDCSLKCTDLNARLTDVDEVVIFKEGRDVGQRIAGAPPPLIWALCFQGKLKFPMIANARLSAHAVKALVDFEKRRDQTKP